MIAQAKRKEIKMRNTNCIFLNQDDQTTCTDKPKYTVDIWNDPDESGKRTMAMVDFECCEKHYQEAESHPVTHLNNVRVKQI